MEYALLIAVVMLPLINFPIIGDFLYFTFGLIIFFQKIFHPILLNNINLDSYSISLLFYFIFISVISFIYLYNKCYFPIDSKLRNKEAIREAELSNTTLQIGLDLKQQGFNKDRYEHLIGDGELVNIPKKISFISQFFNRIVYLVRDDIPYKVKDIYCKFLSNYSNSYLVHGLGSEVWSEYDFKREFQLYKNNNIRNFFLIFIFSKLCEILIIVNMQEKYLNSYFKYIFMLEILSLLLYSFLLIQKKILIKYGNWNNFRLNAIRYIVYRYEKKNKLICYAFYKNFFDVKIIENFNEYKGLYTIIDNKKFIIMYPEMSEESLQKIIKLTGTSEQYEIAMKIL
jgi:hypothetical protein